MADFSPPIGQLVRNYTTNLPVFLPEDPDLRVLHARMLEFYTTFQSAADSLGIAEIAQNAVLERAQKSLCGFWAGRPIRPGRVNPEPG